MMTVNFAAFGPLAVLLVLLITTRAAIVFLTTGYPLVLAAQWVVFYRTLLHGVAVMALMGSVFAGVYVFVMTLGINELRMRGRLTSHRTEVAFIVSQALLVVFRAKGWL